jgi:hypothetical protein
MPLYYSACMPLYLLNFSRAPTPEPRPSKSYARWTVRSGPVTAGKWKLRTRAAEQYLPSGLQPNLRSKAVSVGGFIIVQDDAGRRARRGSTGSAFPISLRSQQRI